MEFQPELMTAINHLQPYINKEHMTKELAFAELKLLLHGQMDQQWGNKPQIAFEQAKSIYDTQLMQMLKFGYA